MKRLLLILFTISIVASYAQTDTYVSIRISMVGDLMAHDRQIGNSKTTNGYDFNPSFQHVRDYLSKADFTIGNFETVCSGTATAYKGYPVFNTPDEMVTALKNAGFDMLITANNHSMDGGESGLLRTLDIINKEGLDATGSYKNTADADSIRINNIQGIKLATLAYTYGVNGNLPSNNYMLNVIDPEKIKGDVKKARANGAELVLVYLHYGKENARYPSDEQKQIVESVRKAGADIIIGCHPHVISPIDYFTTNNATLDTGLVAYSLGNFLSNQYWRYTDAGIVLTVELQKNLTSGEIKISRVEYLPTWVYRGMNKDVVDKHIIMPATWWQNHPLPYIQDKQQDKMKEALEDTKAIIKHLTTNKLYQAY